MKTDISQIGIFGLSFSRDLDQTWFNLWRKDEGYSADLYQFVMDDDADDDADEFIETSVMISFEQGEALLTRAFEDGRIEEWETSYAAADDNDGIQTEWAWTLDIDDLQEGDLIFSSGNGKLPPHDMIAGVVEAIRTCEPGFAKCIKEL
jgi:hypothetical protein